MVRLVLVWDVLSGENLKANFSCFFFLSLTRWEFSSGEWMRGEEWIAHQTRITSQCSINWHNQWRPTRTSTNQSANIPCSWTTCWLSSQLSYESNNCSILSSSCNTIQQWHRAADERFVWCLPGKKWFKLKNGKKKTPRVNLPPPLSLALSVPSPLTWASRRGQ